ncbi:MAG: hypothetical protein LBN35_02060 [Clostridiales Family XIII bacterium]|jgi:hypothetical protein|nr:hypothetical protein [Clostridiales Family XIII bacterium]
MPTHATEYNEGEHRVAGEDEHGVYDVDRGLHHGIKVAEVGLVPLSSDA